MIENKGKKIEVYSLEELSSLPEGLKYFACIGGNKNFECYLESVTLSRASFMEKYLNELDKCHIPIYEDENIIIRQDAQIAIPGFYIVATRKSYKNISQMDLNTYYKCLYFSSLVRKGLKENFGIERAYMYYDEHYNKQSSTHFWVMPIYDEVIEKNNLNATILSRDIWEYQDLFKFSETKKDIYEMNEGMRKTLIKERKK